MDAQEIFDTVLVGLRLQGKASLGHHPRSFSDIAGCVYRGDGGTKCAAGMLIPDHLYQSSMEGSSIGLVIDETPALAHLYEHRYLLDDLQQAHDEDLACCGMEAWEKEMAQIAQSRGLVYTA